MTGEGRGVLHAACYGQSLHGRERGRRAGFLDVTGEPRSAHLVSWAPQKSGASGRRGEGALWGRWVWVSGKHLR